jgi:energy-coupling factor transport system ATP-binding protein
VTGVTGSLEYRGVAFAYPDAAPRALDGVEFAVEAGDVVLVVGSSASGKSTLLRAANGLVPHASGGRVSGDVIVAGRSTRDHKPRDLADVVGFVHQDPEAQFVVDQVEADVAFSLENLGVAEPEMRRRVEEVLDALGVAHLRDRSPTTLSGGERQRAAIAGALAAGPAVLALDEPTSQLDPQGADDVLAAVGRLNADLGTTVLLAEHRLERAAPLAHHALVLDAGRVTATGTPGAVLADYPGAPTVTRLGRLLGWDPPPLTVRDAARFARDTAPSFARSVPLEGHRSRKQEAAASGEALLTATSVTVDLGGRDVLHAVDLGISRGEIVTLLGRNGAGKTTLLRALGNLTTPRRGQVSGPGTVAYVPQDPGSLLFATTVRAEITETLRLLGRPDAAVVDRWIAALHLDAVADRHPRSLSGGERQRVAVAAVAVGGADVLLLDEPTRGMDAPSRDALEHAAREHARQGGAVVLATHDVELAARCATRTVVLGDGEVVADGPARDVLSGSLFAPQVLRVLPPFVTVEEVAAAMAADGR